MSDFDSPWKEALDYYFKAFLEFFFWWIHQDVDWLRGHETLDKELQQIMPDAEVGRRFVDKLMKVWRKSGSECWVLIHIEVQYEAEENFAERMFVYNYRLRDRYGRQVASLAVLGDDDPDWKPDHFASHLWRCELDFRFPSVKLLNFAAQADVLEKHPNPFATVVLAHLKARETVKDAAARQSWKIRLVKGLYERGLKREDVQQLFRFIDWMLELPKPQEIGFREEMFQYEEEKRMPYVTSIERLAREEGKEEGKREGKEEGKREGKEEGKREGKEEGKREGKEEGKREASLRSLSKAIKIVLEMKFGAAGLELLPEISQIQKVEALEAILEKIPTCATIEELRNLGS